MQLAYYTTTDDVVEAILKLGRGSLMALYMRAKAVHTSFDCSVFLAEKLGSMHGGNSCSKRECKVHST